MMKIFSLLSLLVFSNTSVYAQKFIGLMAVRNEENIIEQSLKLMSYYVDEIIVLDDFSTDSTVEKIRSISQECKISRLILKKEWYRDEPGDKNKLLEAGRNAGGTHFLVLDADEVLTSNLLNQDYLRNFVMDLQKGDQVFLRWYNMWRNPYLFRSDQSVFGNSCGNFIFADDGICFYESDFLHTSRCPTNLQGKVFRLDDRYGVMHFQFVNWDNLLVKQVWYRCLERIRNPEKSAEEINKIYAPSKDESGLVTTSAPQEWFENYLFDPKVYSREVSWRKNDIYNWINYYGIGFFSELEIFDIGLDLPVQ